MPRKSNNQQNNHNRLGSLGEAIAHSYLLEFSDFCYPTCEGHPADLIVEFGSALYKVQVRSRNRSENGKYTFPLDSHRKKSDTHKKYHCELYAFIFFPEKRILFKANNTQQRYFIFRQEHLIDGMEEISLKQSLEDLSKKPVIDHLFTTIK